MKTVAFVPLRLNSQRVAGKNLRLLGGEPLMCHILRTLAGIGEIDEVYAYCSDERICEYLPRSVRFLRRSPGLDRDTTLGREIYDSFTADVEADLYVLAHATSPFIRAETVADALRHVRSGEYDSAFSAEKIQTFDAFLVNLGYRIRGSAKGKVHPKALQAVLDKWKKPLFSSLANGKGKRNVPY